MARNEHLTRVELIDPALVDRGWTDDLVREDLFQFLLDTGGPHQKTIVFCARNSHANQVMIALNNLYADWCRKVRRAQKEWYAFQCTVNHESKA